jgi:hypothetical protein
MINLINIYNEINCQLLSNYEEDKINIKYYPNCSNKYNGTLEILKSDKFNLIKNNFNSKDIDIIHNNLIKSKGLAQSYSLSIFDFKNYDFSNNNFEDLNIYYNEYDKVIKKWNDNNRLKLSLLKKYSKYDNNNFYLSRIKIKQKEKDEILKYNECLTNNLIKLLENKKYIEPLFPKLYFYHDLVSVGFIYDKKGESNNECKIIKDYLKSLNLNKFKYVEKKINLFNKICSIEVND